MIFSPICGVFLSYRYLDIIKVAIAFHKQPTSSNIHGQWLKG